MGNNRTYRLILLVVCFLFAGLQVIKIIRNEYSWLNVFFLVTFLSIGILYLILFLKQKKS